MLAPSDIVIVDDNATDLEIVTRICKQVLPNCLFHGLQDGEELESAIAKQTPKLVLVDHYLGKTVGTGLIKSLSDRYKDTVFVLLTNSKDKDIVLEAMRAGAADYVRKDELSADTFTSLLTRIEKRVHQMEEANRILAVLDDGIVTIDAGRNIVNCNYAAEEILKLNEFEVQGRSFLDFVIKRDKNLIDAIFALQGSMMEKSMNITLVNALTEEVPIKLTIKSIGSQSNQSFVAILRRNGLN